MTVINEIRRLAPPNVDARYVSGGSLIDALTGNFWCNRFSEMTRPPVANWPPFERSRGLVLMILRNKEWVPQRWPGTDESKYLDAVLHFCAGRSFITTKEGYVGLAPKAAKPGDQICVLLGCSVPIVLRPTSGFQFKVVGECYVHGLQQGQAFLGGFSDDYQPLLMWDGQDEQHYVGFVNEKTGHVQYEGPRLEDGDWETSQRAPFRCHDVRYL